MEHYYSENQKSEMNIKKIRQKIRGIDFEFYTASGVFSKDKIDQGTLVLAENMLIEKNSKILDIGCGNGEKTNYTAKRGFTAVGIDASEEAINYAKKQFPELKFYQRDALSTKFKDKTFDAIASIAVFQQSHKKKQLYIKLSFILLVMISG